MQLANARQMQPERQAGRYKIVHMLAALNGVEWLLLADLVQEPRYCIERENTLALVWTGMVAGFDVLC